MENRNFKRELDKTEIEVGFQPNFSLEMVDSPMNQKIESIIYAPGSPSNSSEKFEDLTPPDMAYGLNRFRSRSMNPTAL